MQQLEDMKFLFPDRPGNGKLGSVAATTSPEATCPTSCPLKANGCYADSGHINVWWKRVSRGDVGISFERLLHKIQALPKHTAWRWGQAGDLPGDGENVYPEAVRQLADANNGRPGWAYTHYKPEGVNAEAIKDANKRGFRINLSADNPTEADEFMALGIAPVVCVVPHDTPRVSKTPAGNTIVICPEQYMGEEFTCAHCLLCTRNRKAIVGFRVHGSGKKKAEIVART